MNKLFRIFTPAAVLLFTAAAAYTQAPKDTAPKDNPAGNASRGKELFTKYSCYACHGFSGQNGNGARLVPMKFAQSAFIAYVRNPPRANQMPSYSPKVLADKDLTDIYAYIKTLPDSAPRAEGVPILNQILREAQ
ncbi:MAG TPA: cytochrome c [Bryobacteraceae bacterium]|jgi:mono/diheme cytochrome c family protein|nr:cytochrome c [Bryobacteraceae bacterium]